MTLDEFMEQVEEQLRYIQFNAVGKVDLLTEEVQKLRHDIGVLKSKVFELENRGVSE